MHPLIKESDFCWRLSKDYKKGMRVDGLIYADEILLEHAFSDGSIEQVANVACLPGLVKASLAMPDIHMGYGFCIGGVGAMDPDEDGVILPGGVGYDINCGVRLIRSRLTLDDVQKNVEPLMAQLFQEIPSGTGKESKTYQFSKKEMQSILSEGPQFLVKRRGLGTDSDLEFSESRGVMESADPDVVSQTALKRGENQCGTLGSGNHFLEVQVVEDVFDEVVATRFGLARGQICVMIHSGSRGLGHQVCTDYLKEFRSVSEKFKIRLPDKQLVAAPIQSKEGQKYFAAMSAAANFAWANRHLLMIQTREVFEKFFHSSASSLGMSLVYDLTHNIAKFESHIINKNQKKFLVHRKGAARAFPAKSKELPSLYFDIGQPVIVPGSMGSKSYVLVGSDESMKKTFGSCSHGAGRRMSRSEAVSTAVQRLGEREQNLGSLITEELKSLGVIAMARSRRELAEEQPSAYKDIDRVIQIIHDEGLAKKVISLRPLGVVKG